MSALITLVPLSAVCGLFTAYVFRRFSAPGTKQSVNRILAHLMELRLFIDEPGIVWRVQRDLVRENLRLFRFLTMPILITLPLMALVIWQADRIYGHGPLKAGEAVVVTAHAIDGELKAPPVIDIETPGVRIPSSHEVSWRIRPSRSFSGKITLDGKPVEIPWPQARIAGVSWLVWFFVISSLAAFVKWPRATLALFLLVHSASAADKTPVILISIDTLRADHVTKARAPDLVAIGEKGSVWQRIDTQIPLTLPSHTVLMTSTYPFTTQVEANDELVPGSVVTLASVLQTNGYRTAAFIGSMILAKRYGLDKGFETYDAPFEGNRVRRDAALVTRAARQWLEKNKAEPFFAFLHLYDLHTPYTLPQVAALTPNAAGYDAELQYVDQTLGRFRNALMTAGIWDKALVIVTADHGESLGDHGETSHGFFIYESTMHVPLIVHWPADSAPHPQSYATPGGLIDVAPTILDFLHIPAPPSFAGVSLLAGREHDIYGESLYPQENFGWAALHSLQTGALKYIDAPRPELYDLVKDPGERTNIYSPRAQSMKTRLDALRVKYASPAKPVSETTSQNRAVLGSLGYTSGHQKPAEHPADPKDKIGEQEAFETGLTCLYSGDFPKAIATLEKIIRQDPKNLAALNAAGEAYGRAGNLAKAREAFQHVLERDPKNQIAAEGLNRYGRP